MVEYLLSVVQVGDLRNPKKLELLNNYERSLPQGSLCLLQSTNHDTRKQFTIHEVPYEHGIDKSYFAQGTDVECREISGLSVETKFSRGPTLLELLFGLAPFGEDVNANENHVYAEKRPTTDAISVYKSARHGNPHHIFTRHAQKSSSFLEKFASNGLFGGNTFTFHPTLITYSLKTQDEKYTLASMKPYGIVDDIVFIRA